MATVEQLKRKFFKDASIKNLRRRLRKLSQAGYLTSTWYELDQGSFKLYLLNKNKDWKQILEEDFEVEPFHSSSVVHDLILSDLSEVLSTYQVSSDLVTENLLKGFGKYQDQHHLAPFRILNTDIVWFVDFESDHFTIALEYERRLKKKTDYIKKFKEYYNQEEIKAVFYIVENKSMLRKLIEFDIEAKNKMKTKFFFVLKDEILSKPKVIQFISSEKTMIKIR